MSVSAEVKEETMISHKHKCIFIHIPKCAGTSIERALGHLDNHTGREGQDHRSIRMIEQPLITPHIFSSKENICEVLRRALHKKRPALNPRNKLAVTRKQYQEYFKFTIIRNPWARVFSWYRNVMGDEIHRRDLEITADISLAEFLRKHAGKGMLRTQTYWIKSFDGSIKLDFIGRFENLAEDFRRIAAEINMPHLELPHEIRGTGEDYAELYDQEAKRIVSDVYREEIELFKYSFGRGIY